MRKVQIAILILIVLIVVLAVRFEWLYYSDRGDYASRRITFKVAPGATLRDVQADLVAQGILTRPNVFRWAAYITRRETKIKSGRYLFRCGESVASILKKLVAGEVEYARVVIPEGLMLKEIASILQEETEVDSAAFVEAAYDTAMLDELGIQAPSLEGYLFPDTYHFDWPMDEKDAIRRMVYRFKEVYTESAAGVADTLGMSMNDVVTLASIIESEAAFRSEMPQISAVYHNRLKADWRLEADPTVAYALGGVRRKLLMNDLKVDSPYNTYRTKGLPPGAICSPGQSALEAAVRPAGGCLDFYFVADGTGRHKFSFTYVDHLKAKHMMKYGPVPESFVERSAADTVAGADSLQYPGTAVPDSGGASPPDSSKKD